MIESKKAVLHPAAAKRCPNSLSKAATVASNAPTDLIAVRDGLEAAGMTVESAEPAMVATTTVPVTEEGEARRVLRLLEALDDHDDVQNVWSNFDIPDEVLAAAAD